MVNSLVDPKDMDRTQGLQVRAIIGVLYGINPVSILNISLQTIASTVA